MDYRTNTLAILMTVAASSQVSAIEAASEIFKKNCSACHQLDNKKSPVVGPSLIEINHLYKKRSGQKKFIDWCVKPGKVRADAIQMPSMAHLKVEELAAIHGWIKEATKGKAFVKGKKKKEDKFKLSEKASKQPRIQRIFLPFTSPASMAITIDGQNSLCWDTLSCRLRYTWNGGFIDGYPYWSGNGGSIATLVGEMYYQAPLDLDASMKVSGSSPQAKYRGYKVLNGLPEFHYTIGKVKVAEAISNNSGKIIITIKTTGVVGSLTYPLGNMDKCDFSYSKGKLVDGSLVVNAKDASEFKMNFSAKQK